MTIGKKQRQSLPIETEAYKKEQEFLREAAIKDRLDAGEIITNPADFPRGTPKDVVAVSRGRNVSIKTKTTKDVTKLPPAKAANSKTTAEVKNPRKAQKQETTMTKTATKKAAKAPAKKAAAKKAANGEGRGRTSVMSGKTIYATPETLKKNPRRDKTAGWYFVEIVRKAGKKGIKYEDLRKHEHFGTSHMMWDLNKGYITAK